MVVRTRNGEKISIDIIRKLEDELGIKFPIDYVEFIKDNNSARVRPKHFRVNDNVESINNFHNVSEAYHFTDERLPEKVIPFARDAGDNQICFDYRNGNKISVLFWDYGSPKNDGLDLSLVSESFGDFLNALFEFEE